MSDEGRCQEVHESHSEARCHHSAAPHREHDAESPPGSGNWVTWPNAQWHPQHEPRATAQSRMHRNVAAIRGHAADQGDVLHVPIVSPPILPSEQDLSDLRPRDRRALCAAYGQEVTPQKIDQALELMRTAQSGRRHAEAWDTEEHSADLAIRSSVSVKQGILFSIFLEPAGDAEISVKLELLKLTVGAWRNALMMNGLIEATEERRPTGHGDGKEIVWKVTPLGAAVVPLLAGAST